MMYGIMMKVLQKCLHFHPKVIDALTKESKTFDGHHVKLVEPIKEEEIDSDCLARTGNG